MKSCKHVLVRNGNEFGQDGLAPLNFEGDLEVAARMEATFQQIVNRHKGDMIAVIQSWWSFEVVDQPHTGTGRLANLASFSLWGIRG